MAIVSVQNYPAPAIILGAVAVSALTITMDNAAENSDCAAFSFVAPKNPFGGSMTFSGFRAYFGTASGSPKVTAYIYDDNAGVPNAAVANGTSSESGVISTNSWVEIAWAGTLPALTEGTQYWVVLKCTSGTSLVVNFLMVSANTGGVLVGSQGVGSGKAWRNCHDASTDNASTWGGTDRGIVIGHRYKITDGTDVAYWGIPVQGVSLSSGDKVDGTIEAGLKLTTPASCNIRVKTVALTLRKILTPGNLCVKLYTGNSTTATATSNSIPVSNVSTASAGDVYHFDFSVPVALSGATTYRFVLSAASGDSSNYYLFYDMAIDSDSVTGGTVDLLPWAIQEAVLSSGSWTDNPAFIGYIAMILDSTSPLTAPDFPAVGNVTEDVTVNGSTGTYRKWVHGFGTVTKETGANARGGSGSCAKLNPSSAVSQLYWQFLIPVTAATAFTLKFWHKITSGFNGSVKVTVYDSDDDATLLHAIETVSLTDDEAYHEWTSSSLTPTDTGLCRVKIEVLDGASTGDVYIDDISVV